MVLDYQLCTSRDEHANNVLLNLRPASRPDPVCSCLQAWATETSDALDHVKHWIYLVPDTWSPSSFSSGQPSGNKPNRSGRITTAGKGTGQSEEAATSGDDGPTYSIVPAGGQEKRQEKRQEHKTRGNVGAESPWAREHTHIAEWAEFLWRVARPGVNPRSFAENQDPADEEGGAEGSLR